MVFYKLKINYETSLEKKRLAPLVKLFYQKLLNADRMILITSALNYLEESNYHDFMLFLQQLNKSFLTKFVDAFIGIKNKEIRTELIRSLKEMGFETYDDIFDESYDEMETWEERTKAVWKEIEKVLTLSDSEFYEEFNKVQEKVIYNQKRFFAYDGYVDDFIIKLMKIYEETSIPI